MAGNVTIPLNGEDAGPSPDHAFDRLLPELVECFGVTLIGFVAGRAGLLSKAEAGGLNYFAANFALPAMIFLNLARLDASNVQWPFVTGILLSKILIFLVVVLVTLTAIRPLDLGQAAIYGIFATHVNDFGLAYPILLSIYGESHPSYPNFIYLIGLISLALLNPVGFLMIEIQRVRDKSKATNLDPPGSPDLLNRPPSRRKKIFRMVCSILKRIVTNPNVFMTVLGALANVVFAGRLPEVVVGILKNFGDTFPGTVLFLLGLQVANTTVNKKSNYVVPGLLLTVKMLISPLVTRGTVKLLCSHSADAAGLADYGFLYGTVPTAPVVLVYAAQFSMPTEMLALALVLCTLLSGPVMYVSARMLVVQAYDILSYMKQLRETILCISALGIVSCFWVAFLFILTRKWKKPPHLALLLLIIAQAVMSGGLLIWSTAPHSAWTTYLDISAVTGGQLASRFCAVILAIVLFLTPKYSPQGMFKLLPFLVLFGFGLPAVAVLCLLVAARHIVLSGADIVPSFLFGDTEACMAVIVLSFCLVATSGCLLLFHRQNTRETTTTSGSASDISPVLSDSSDLSTIQEESPKQIAEEDGAANIPDLPFDVPKLKVEAETWDSTQPRPGDVTPKRRKKIRKKSLTSVNTSLPVLMGKQFVAWAPPVAPFDDQKEYPLDVHEIQASRHITLLLYLCVSMIVGLTTSIWKLLAEERTGIFVALEFLDIILNFGQPIICAVIFGHDLEPVTEPIRNFFQKWKQRGKKRPSPPAVSQDPQPMETRRHSSGLVTGSLPP